MGRVKPRVLKPRPLNERATCIKVALFLCPIFQAKLKFHQAASCHPEGRGFSKIRYTIKFNYFPKVY